MFGQVEKGGEAAGRAGELGRPAGQMGQVAAAGGQPRLQITLEPEQQLGRLPVEGEQGGALVPGGSGQAGGQSVKLQGVAIGHCRRHRWGAGLAAADHQQRSPNGG
jgi:hypothetical protein